MTIHQILLACAGRWPTDSDRPGTAVMNRDDPAARAMPDDSHLAATVMERVNGHVIRAMRSPRFGLLYTLDYTEHAFSRIEDARAFALGPPSGKRA